MSTSVYPPPLYTEAQATFLAIIPYFTAPWSVAGSSLILWSIWYDRKELLKHVYHRIMVGISFFDWMSSMGLLIFGPWAVPSDWPYGRSGRGTVGTCEASGFFLNLSFGAMWYTVFLAIHFVMLLRWEWKERWVYSNEMDSRPYTALTFWFFLFAQNLPGMKTDCLLLGTFGTSCRLDYSNLLQFGWYCLACV